MNDTKPAVHQTTVQTGRPDAQPSDQPPPVATWSYRAVSWCTGDGTDTLNALGLGGWELVSVTVSSGTHTAHLKRPGADRQGPQQQEAVPPSEAERPPPATPERRAAPPPEKQDDLLPDLHPGEIWLVTVPAMSSVTAITGRRPVVVLETEQNVAYVVALTSHLGRIGVYIPAGSGNERASIALTETLRALSGDAFIRCLGRVTDRLLNEIENDVDERSNQKQRRR